MIAKNKLNLLGKKFVYLTVLSEAPVSKHQKSRWNCKCICGKIITVDGGSLIKVNTWSCGCMKKKMAKIRMTEDRRTGKVYKKGLPNGESALNSLISQYKNRANRKNVDYNLTRELFKKLTSSNCYYCNKTPSQIQNPRSSHGPYIYNGIDRLDNLEGYTINNSVACCGMCNWMKSDLNENEFINHIKRILITKGKINEEA